MLTSRIPYIVLLSLFLVIARPALAQNTGGVFPPTVTENHKSWQYRIALDPDNAAGETGYAQRLHYQQAIDDKLMWRIVGQLRKTQESDFDADFLQAELFWELSETGAEYQTGFRFDARLRDGDRPDQLGLNWIHAFRLNQGWSARAILLTSTQIGSNTTSGVNLQTRGQLSRRLEGGQTIGLEVFNNYGNSKNIGSFDQQDHTLGPIFSMPLNSKVSLFAGALFGISDAAPDTQFRLWLTRPL